GPTQGRLELQVPGRYNLSNAAAAYCVGSLLGISHQDLLTGIASFTGTLRRFQLVGRVADVSVFDDYAHHPTELRATLGAARRVV
ncbi:UDP-N-acetylmuramate--L-alanine ligase, partial [Xanthomonas citri pv. citri]|nr:UDP-N-acetylmuramate--L-alanine ligase [Xanthomonas citri pv. citri]